MPGSSSTTRILTPYLAAALPEWPKSVRPCIYTHSPLTQVAGSAHTVGPVEFARVLRPASGLRRSPYDDYNRDSLPVLVTSQGRILRSHSRSSRLVRVAQTS